MGAVTMGIASTITAVRNRSADHDHAHEHEHGHDHEHGPWRGLRSRTMNMPMTTHHEHVHGAPRQSLRTTTTAMITVTIMAGIPGGISCCFLPVVLYFLLCPMEASAVGHVTRGMHTGELDSATLSGWSVENCGLRVDKPAGQEYPAVVAFTEGGPAQKAGLSVKDALVPCRRHRRIARERPCQTRNDRFQGPCPRQCRRETSPASPRRNSRQRSSALRRRKRSE